MANMGVIKMIGLVGKIIIESSKATTEQVKPAGIKRGIPAYIGENQMIFTPLILQSACNRYRDCLVTIDREVSLYGENSALFIDADPRKLSASIVNWVEDLITQGSLSENLKTYALAVSGGDVVLSLSDTAHSMIKTIAASESVKSGIKSGNGFGDLNASEAASLWRVINALAEIYRDER